MNQNVYDALTQARQKLFDMQASYLGKEIKEDLDVVAMAVDDGLGELDRLAARIKRLESGGK